MKYIPVLFLVSVLLWNCSGNKTEECAIQPDVSPINLQVRIEQFQDTLAGITSKKELVALLSRQPVMRDNLFRRSEYPNDSVFINELYTKFSHPGIDTLLTETKRIFGDLSNLESEFTNAFKNLKHYYPDFVLPRVQSVISGIDGDLFVSDTLIIVSLDHFLGKEGKYRPKMYDYLLRKYDPEDIVPSCILIYGISDNYNKTNLADKTVLADMIAYGKSFYFAKHMLPCVPDSTLIWYTAPEMKGAHENEDLIWARFIQDKVLYSTSMIEKRNYLGERPATIQVGEKCPGRIGQWVGWRIVQQYMQKHPEITLPQLMSDSDAQKIFKESNYKPKRR
ncbi:gliding motility lipoprotein GldB [Chryseosolibacter indicus]|uniref:Gliding motility lipoprotein GldB n=1 Tax=Chryseosolibacter indicus TaxID=2782351 RepID=A0ABS5VTH7_9BACT|nr:gliding motility lipoprotein GldB [Chryseosolibacter indicus]MBT1704363.1 gliding motility lipoprotein GldB [Chryseosolibacter indicus]